MKAPAQHQREDIAVDLIEEAVHLLRTAPPGVWTPWVTGALPFVLALLYFWSAMSRGTSGEHTIAEASLGLAAAFLWMKFWQAVFALRLRAWAALEQEKLNFSQILGIIATQSAIQPLALFTIPLAAAAVLPFPWVFAFFQNVTAEGNGRRSTRETIAIATRFAAMQPGYNIRLLLLTGGFGFFVFLNWVTAGIVLPGLIQTLSGVNSTVMLNTFAMLNSTFFAVICALTFLSLDPIVKAVYVLRCFHGESVHSGEDLASELRRLRPGAPVVALLLAALVCFGGFRSTGAESAPSGPARAAEQVDTAKLGHAIDEVLDQEKYSWRTPREREAKSTEDGIITRFLKDAARFVKKIIKAVWDWIDELLSKLRPKPKNLPGHSPGYGWITSLQVLLWCLLAIVAIILALALLRWKQARRREAIAAASPLQPAPNLNDENVGPEQLPEDGWIRLGRELLAKGEYRLALRAFYLSSLASLAERKFITLARFKSNREYERELNRRAHQIPTLLQSFSWNVSVFEQAWYGSLMLDEPTVLRFEEAVRQMKAPQ